MATYEARLNEKQAERVRKNLHGGQLKAALISQAALHKPFDDQGNRRFYETLSTVRVLDGQVTAFYQADRAGRVHVRSVGPLAQLVRITEDEPTLP